MTEPDDLRSRVELLARLKVKYANADPKHSRIRDINALVAEVERLRGEKVRHARTCDDCPGGKDWQDEAERLRGEVQRHQLGESYQVGYEHGSAAATNAYAHMRGERDDVIRRYEAGWRPHVVGVFGTWERWEQGHRSEPMTPAEVEAIRAARDHTEPGT